EPEGTVPHIATLGWARFAERSSISSEILELRARPWPLVGALGHLPQTLLHGDWKMGNLGSSPDGRTVLLDWAVPGAGVCTSDLLWYLAVNRARLPHTKEDAIDAYRASLERAGIDTDQWWDRAIGLTLVGALVQFGWEKALGDADELAWWEQGARRHLGFL
ncbi:MAG: phosphotransferase, partial [Acidobacteria bacterium]|nr:phosphotransferase [Acidobacteriota bacterium]